MKFVYQPEGADPREWEFKPGKLQNVEAQAIEKATGMFYGEAFTAALGGSITCRAAFLWVFQKRTNPTLKIHQVQFGPSDVGMVWDEDEEREILGALEVAAANGEPFDDDDTQTLADLRARYPQTEEPETAPSLDDLDMDAALDPETSEADGPKGPEESSEMSTSGTLPSISSVPRLSSTA